MMEAENPKASLTSYKGHFTRQKRAFDRRLDEFKLHPEVAENWGMLDSAFKKYQKGYDQLETAFVAVQLLDANPDYEYSPLKYIHPKRYSPLKNIHP